MAGMADLFAPSDAPGRLLSARSGNLNVIQNEIPRSGYAAPGLGFLLGREARANVDTQEQQAKYSNFFTAFSKMTAANKGAAVKMWNDAGPELGLPPIDSVDVDDTGSTVRLADSGNFYKYGPSGIYKWDNQTWVKATNEDLAQEFQAKKELKSTAPAKPNPKDLTADQLKVKIAELKTRLAGMSPLTAADKQTMAEAKAELAELEDLWYKKTGQTPPAPAAPVEIPQAPPVPALQGGAVPAAPNNNDLKFGGLSRMQPGAPARRPLPTF